jgi:hypothetical protein
MSSLASEIPFPAPIAPAHQIYIRDPANRSLIPLLQVEKGNLIWWGRKQDELPATAISAIGSDILLAYDLISFHGRAVAAK